MDKREYIGALFVRQDSLREGIFRNILFKNNTEEVL